MIDWELTKQKFGRTDLSGPKPRIVVRCDVCRNAISVVAVRVKSSIINNQRAWRCRKCISNDPGFVKKLKERWTDAYRENASKSGIKQWENPEYKKYMSDKGKKQWDARYREKMKMLYYHKDSEYSKKVSSIQNRPETKSKKSKAIKAIWEQDPSYRGMTGKLSERVQRLWEDQVYRNKVVYNTSKALADPVIKKKLSEAAKNKWKNPRFRKKVIPKLSNTMKERFKDQEFLAKHKERCHCPEFIKAAKDRWKDPVLRERMKVKFTDEVLKKMSVSSKKKWEDPKYQAKCRSMSKVSSLQKILYSILDDLKIEYYREHEDGPDDPQCIIGPYTFDCVVPREGKPTLLIECQGEYWHRDSKKTSDKQKASYILNHFQGQYEIKYIWEHEFKCQNKIVELIKYWTGASKFELIDFNFSDVIIKKSDDYRLFLGKYHYLLTAGRGGISYGAYLNSELIAVCVFSPLPRQNTGFNNSDTRDLSRLCIHPKYQKKNFASWFVSRCIKMLPECYKNIVSYCDTTFNHNGAVYKACGFKKVGTVDPDYWYVSEDGWVMHKKTLYNHANNMSMKEAEYAKSKGYEKVYGKSKIKFLFVRS